MGSFSVREVLMGVRGRSVSLILVCLALVGVFKEDAAAQSPREDWVVIVRPTDVYTDTGEVAWTAEAGEWYRVTHIELDWVIAVWENDPPESTVWIERTPRIELRSFTSEATRPSGFQMVRTMVPSPPQPPAQQQVIVVTATPVSVPQVIVVVAPTFEPENLRAVAVEECNRAQQRRRELDAAGVDRLYAFAQRTSEAAGLGRYRYETVLVLQFPFGDGLGVSCLGTHQNAVFRLSV
jgi:hypothetical protein